MQGESSDEVAVWVAVCNFGWRQFDWTSKDVGKDATARSAQVVESAKRAAVEKGFPMKALSTGTAAGRSTSLLLPLLGGSACACIASKGSTVHCAQGSVAVQPSSPRQLMRWPAVLPGAVTSCLQQRADVRMHTVLHLLSCNENEAHWQCSWACAACSLLGHAEAAIASDPSDTERLLPPICLCPASVQAGVRMCS